MRLAPRCLRLTGPSDVCLVCAVRMLSRHSKYVPPPPSPPPPLCCRRRDWHPALSQCIYCLCCFCRRSRTRVIMYVWIERCSVSCRLTCVLVTRRNGYGAMRLPNSCFSNQHLTAAFFFVASVRHVSRHDHTAGEFLSSAPTWLWRCADVCSVPCVVFRTYVT